MACLILALLPCTALADDNSLGMSYVLTPDLRLVYFDPLGNLVPHAVRTATNALAWQRRIFGWVPSESTTILLKDLSDYGNAVTWAAPLNTMFLDVAPLSHAFETYPASERLYTLMNHETVHVSNNDIAGEQERRWRRFFLGKVTPQAETPESLLYSYLTVPRFMAPRWYAEGAAVFMETWMGGGLGRAQGGYDEMVFRAMVRDDAHFYDPLGLVSRGVLVDFQTVSNAYLYGTRFFTWLAYVHSPEKVVEWLRRDDGSARYYADNFQVVFGMPLDEAWSDWIAFEHDFQKGNLAAVREHPVTPYRTLGHVAVGSISRLYYDEPAGKLYGAFRYPGVVEHVGVIDTRAGSLERLADIKRAMLYRVASFAFDPATGTAFYTNDNLALRDLMAVDVKTGESRMLLENARIGEMVFNPADRSLIGVQHANGLATLVRIAYPYTEWTAIHTFPYEFVPYDLDISPDGRLLSASMSEVDGEQYLRVWDLAKLLQDDVRPLSEYRFGQSVPESFVFSRDGRYLYGSSYYTGVSNIFRYEVATGKVEAVSNAETGFFRPMPLSDGRLLVLVYTAEGFVPATIEPRPLEDVGAITFLGAEVAAKYPIVTKWQVPAPSTVDYEALVLQQGPYDPLANVRLVNAYPTVQGYKNTAGIGYRFNFEDPIRFASVSATLAYTPGGVPPDERVHADVAGSYLGWHGELWWNKSDFYDLFGPTKLSRKGFAAKGGYDWLVVFDEPRRLDALFDVGWYDQIDTLPGAQNVSTTFTQLFTANVGLRFADLRRSLGAVDDEKGLAWSAFADGNFVPGQAITQVHGTFDYGIPAAPHSSIWLRSYAGWSVGARNNPLSSYYFGGFGNNYVDRGPEKRYREPQSMPGFAIDEVSGRDYFKQMVEWNLPPLVFESVGTPGFYVNWLRPAVFAIGLWTDPATGARQDYASVGGQLDFRFKVLHWYDMTLSAGFAGGFRGSRQAGTEWMVSLKVL
jgi:hypothetical protein